MVLTLRGRPFVGLGAVSTRARLALLAATISGVVLNLAIFVAFGRITVALALLGFYTYPALVTVGGRGDRAAATRTGARSSPW